MHSGHGAKIKVLMVDDSPSILSLLQKGFANHQEIEVVGTAKDAYDAREKIKALNPDVITLDVEMPRMSGLDFLERLMRLRPMPVVMLSSVTPEGSAAAVRALSLGAVDVQVKPSRGFNAAFMKDFAARVVAAARSRSRPVQPLDGLRAIAAPANTAGFGRWNGKIVLIGASTGGVSALETVMRSMPADGPPIVVSQHMPEVFLRSFAERLHQKNAMNVQVATDGTVLKQGHVYLAPGGDRHTIVEQRGKTFVCADKHGPKTNGHYPSVDELFHSAVPFGELVVGALLTGLGRDGAAGLKALKDAGASTIGQDENTSTVYGMPRAAFEIGAVDTQLPIDAIARQICRLTDKSMVTA
ncbi:chemotaxis-specific protein-glutamate methyltransferase CheB [Pseudooceanicola sp. MF1-13]|uniref:chemotaxis-specific protein-glutamate methyltransferase CheB n=1 Tax=Pseudooceanicola sp. MF1-13 TaxID=3379095 RepID=UPI003891F41E